MEKNLKICMVAVLFAAFALVSCSNNVESWEESEKTLSLTTFNAKMTDDLPYKKARFFKMREVFAENSSDILCIQDVFGNSYLDEVRKMLENDYGYDYALYAKTSNEDKDLEFTTEQTIPAACTMDDLTPVISCISENCSDFDAACIAQNCWQSFLELPSDCQSCMLSNGISAISSGNYLEILEKCQQETKIPAKRLEYEFNGNSGVLLASKLPMSHKQPIKLRSYGRMRTALAANVEKAGIGKIQVICTGLSPLSETEYDGFGESWEDEQMTQIEQILAIPVDDDVVQRVILGDFNGNLALGELRASNPDPVSVLEENGWYDPYFDMGYKETPECTVCRENPFVSAETEESVPNHILFRHRKGFDFFARRIFYDNFLELDYEHMTKKTYSVSDSYGITAMMKTAED